MSTHEVERIDWFAQREEESYRDEARNILDSYAHPWDILAEPAKTLSMPSTCARPTPHGTRRVRSRSRSIRKVGRYDSATTELALETKTYAACLSRTFLGRGAKCNAARRAQG